MYIYFILDAGQIHRMSYLYRKISQAYSSGTHIYSLGIKWKMFLKKIKIKTWQVRLQLVPKDLRHGEWRYLPVQNGSILQWIHLNNNVGWLSLSSFLSTQHSSKKWVRNRILLLLVQKQVSGSQSTGLSINWTTTWGSTFGFLYSLDVLRYTIS